MAVTKLRSLRCLYMNNNRLTKLHPRYRKIQCYLFNLQDILFSAKSKHYRVDVGWKWALNFIFSLKEMVSLGYIWLRGNKLQSLPVELCTVRRVFKMTENSELEVWILLTESAILWASFWKLFSEKYQSDSFRIQRNWIYFGIYWSLTQPQTTLSNRVQNNKNLNPTYGPFFRSIYSSIWRKNELSPKSARYSLNGITRLGHIDYGI